METVNRIARPRMGLTPDRRQFVTLGAASMVSYGWPQFAGAQTSQLTPARAVSEMRNSVITVKDLPQEGGGKTKDVSGALMLAPYGMLNWYFANLGLSFGMEALTDQEAFDIVLPHLESYLRNLEPQGHIFDVEFPAYRQDAPQPATWRTPERSRDSDDSYAATFLALSAKLFLRLKDSAVHGAPMRQWWSQRQAQITSVAYLNLLKPMKAIGLTPTFRLEPGIPVPAHIERDAVNYPTPADQEAACRVSYLMDNCEVHWGLKLLAQALSAVGDAQARYIDSFVRALETGIAGLFLAQAPGAAAGAYRVAEEETTLNTDFYPGATAQLFPSCLGVATEIDSGRAYAAWAYFKQHAKGWDQWPGGGNGHDRPNKPDAYPWALSAYAVAQARAAGHFSDATLLAQAKRLLSNMETQFAVQTQRGYFMVNELGFYLAAKRLL